MESKDTKQESEVFGSKATYSDVVKDIMSKSRVYDVIYALEKTGKPQFCFFDTKGEAARNFAKSQPYSMVIVHSAEIYSGDE